MSVERLLSQFDVTLSDDVVKEVQATGVPFKREICGEGTGRREFTLILDKSDQDVVRLKVNVYNKEEPENGASKDSQTEHSGAIQEKGETSDTSVQAGCTETEAKNSQTEAPRQSEQHQQTDTQAVGALSTQTETRAMGVLGTQTESTAAALESSYMQTDELEQFDQVSQTERAQLEESFMQTEELDQFEQVTQTDPPPALSESFIQTDPPPPSMELAQQTDAPPEMRVKHVQVTWPSKVTETQTEIKVLSETPCQTELEMTEQVCQTDNMPLADGEVQACVEVIENIAQTDIKEFAETPAQTELKVYQKGVQTLKTPVKSKGSATDPMIIIDPEDQFEMDAQTDPMRVIDPTLDRDAETQTEYGKVIYPEIMYDNVCQTDDVKIVTWETQTEGGSQTDYVFVTNPADLEETSLQTDGITIINPETQVSQEVQTNLVWVMGLGQHDDNSVEREIEPTVTSPSVNPLQVEAGTGITDPLDQGLMQPPPAPPGSLDLGALDAPGPKENDEKWVQTDPVTIIIGDSSFLLQQLANINKSPEVTPQQIPARRKAGRPSANNSIYNRNRLQEANNPPMLERQSNELTGDQAGMGPEGVITTDLVMANDMPTLEAESGQGGTPTTPRQTPIATTGRRGIKMLLPNTNPPAAVKKNPYRGPYSVSGMKPQQQQRTAPITIATMQQDGGSGTMQQFQLDDAQNISAFQQQPQQQPQSEFINTTTQQLQDLDDPGAATAQGGAKSSGSGGKFNCPFCTATFDDTPQLYKHIHEDHGTPRCSTRKARRKGTIIVDDDGAMHIVGEQNTLWELNDENMRRYKRAKRYSPRSSKYTPRLPPKDDTGLFREDEDEVQQQHQIVTMSHGMDPGDDVHGLVAMPTGEEGGELTLQIVQNGAEGTDRAGGVVGTQAQQILMKHSVTATANTSTNPVQHIITTAPAIEKTLQDTITSSPGMTSSPTVQEVAADVSRREFNCPRCPRLFTKSSELYIHLQNSHRAGSSNRGRGRGRGAYHQLHIVDTSDLQDHELIENQQQQQQQQAEPTVIQLQQQQVLGLLPEATTSGSHGNENDPDEGQEVEIRVEYSQEDALGQEFHQQLIEQQQMEEQAAMPLPPSVPPEPIMHEAEATPAEIPEEDEELPVVRVARRGRPPKVKKEEMGEDGGGARKGVKRLASPSEQEAGSPGGGLMVTEEGEEEAPGATPRRRGRSAAGATSAESPAKRPPGRPPAKRGRKH